MLRFSDKKWYRRKNPAYGRHQISFHKKFSSLVWVLTNLRQLTAIYSNLRQFMEIYCNQNGNLSKVVSAGAKNSDITFWAEFFWSSEVGVFGSQTHRQTDITPLPSFVRKIRNPLTPPSLGGWHHMWMPPMCLHQLLIILYNFQLS